MNRITWVAYKIKGTQMKAINLSLIYQLGAAMNELTTFDAKKHRAQIGAASYHIEEVIKQLITEYPELEACKSNCDGFLNSVKSVKLWMNKYYDRKVQRINKADESVDEKFRSLIISATEFNNILSAELAKLGVYYPLQKRAYHTQTLISQTEKIFAQTTLEKLNDRVKEEINECGRCLLFDNYTASGFHIIRALEVVLHNYYVHMCNPTNPNKKLNNWADYLTELYKLFDKSCTSLNDEDKNHVKTVYSLLQLIKNNDRNLIMHPEIMLKEDEAIDLFDKCKTAIEAMAEKL